jgi:hypothetical protein
MRGRRYRWRQINLLNTIIHRCEMNVCLRPRGSQANGKTLIRAEVQLFKLNPAPIWDEMGCNGISGEG